MNTDVEGRWWRALCDCPPDALPWAALTYRLGIVEGCRQERAKIGQAGVNVARAAGPVLRQPRHEDVLRSRHVDHAPCPTKCDACSRCIASRSYWSRGGRPYVGVRREAEIARGAA